MLPDLPQLKADIAQVFHTIFRNRVNAYLGVVGEVPRSVIKEGRSPMILRQDDSRDETTLKAASAELNFKVDEIPHLSVEQRIDRLDTAAREMATQINSQAFESINEAVKKVGNVVDAKGRRFSADALFEVLEKIQVDFEDDGVKHKELTVVIPPALTGRVKEVMEHIHQDPKLRERYKKIIDKKRMEWRDREAARKLVG